MKKLCFVWLFLSLAFFSMTAHAITIASQTLALYEGKTQLLIPYGAPDAKFSFISDNDAVASVDEHGLVRALAPGKATVKITEEGTDQSLSVAVTVQKKRFLYSVYCPPTEAYADSQQYAYMKEAGINTVIMSSFVSEAFMKKSIALGQPHGVSFYVNDERIRDIINVPQETIAAYVNTYKDIEGVIGYYIKDEPLGANPYAPIYRQMADLAPDAYFHLNFYPTGSVEQFGITYEGYIDDWISLLGPAYKKNISFDNYPFNNNSYNESLCMYHFETMHTYARKHDIDFEYFVQSSGLETGYHSNDNSVRYHFSIGLAYGAKSYQYFTWYTPLPVSEAFIPGSAIMTSDGKKGALFNVVKDTNARARKVEPYLAPAEAVAVYHTGTLAQHEKNPPKDFFFQVTNAERAIVSLYQNEAKNTYYILVVNKNYAQESTTYDFALQGVTRVYDLTSGTPQAVSLTDGKFSETIEGGLYRLYTFQDGFNVNTRQPREENLALGMPAYVSTSVGNKSLYAHHLTDGDKDTLWSPTEADEAPYVLIDLKDQCTVGAVHIKAAMDYEQTVHVAVSRDNAVFTTVTEALPLTQDGSTIAFDARFVRYVKLSLPKNVLLSEVGAYEKEPLFLSHAVPYLEEGTVYLRTNGNFENHHIICALYQDGRPTKVRILAGEELTEKEHALFEVSTVQNSLVKSYLMQLDTCIDTLTFAPQALITVSETFDDGYDTARFAAAINGTCNFDNGKMGGFAYSFGTKEPLFISAGYTFSLELAAPATEGIWNTAGVSLRADKTATPYDKSGGILLFFCDDHMGIRTRTDADWTVLMAEGQTMMPLPVSFASARRVTFADNGTDLITITAIGDDGAPIRLGTIELDAHGATLYNADKTASFGTVPAAWYQKSHVGVFSHTTAATFDQIELTYNPQTTKTESFDAPYDESFWIHTASKEISFASQNLQGLAFSFGTKEPLPAKCAYVLSMDIAAPYAADQSPAMSAGIALRSKKLASSYGRGKGILLLIQEDRIGLRTNISRSQWTDVLSENQEMLPIPVSFKEPRRITVRDNGDNEIRILSYDDFGTPVVLGYIHITPTHATLYAPDKKTAYGTLNAENFANDNYLSVFQYLPTATFDNIQLTYTR